MSDKPHPLAHWLKKPKKPEPAPRGMDVEGEAKAAFPYDATGAGRSTLLKMALHCKRSPAFMDALTGAERFLFNKMVRDWTEKG